MKSKPTLAAVFALSIFFGAPAASLHAGAVDDIKAGSRQAASEIKEETIEAGKAAVETGKEIKAGSQKAWKKAKEGFKEVGEDFKKAYQETREAVRKEISGNDSPTEKTQKNLE